MEYRVKLAIVITVLSGVSAYRIKRIWPSKDVVQEELTRQLNGTIVRPWDDDYYDLIMQKNLEFVRRPGAIALVNNRDDIRKCILFARKYKLGVNMRSTGHCFLGRSTADHVLLIDTSRMNEILSINVNDPESETGKSAIVQSGTVWEQIYEEVDKHNLLAIGPNPLSISVTGFLLGGGHGPMTRKYGLGSDNIIRISLVSAVGDYVDCTQPSTFVTRVDGSTETIQNGDLFWALRGGGSAFGVITEFKLKLHPAPPPAPDAFVQINMNMAIEHPVLGEPWKSFLEFYGPFYATRMTNNWGGYLMPNNAPSFDIFWNTTVSGSASVLLLHVGNWTEAMSSIEPLLEFDAGRRLTTFTNHSSFWSYVQDKREGMQRFMYAIVQFMQRDDVNDNLVRLLSDDLLDTFQLRGCMIISLGGRAAEIPAETSAVGANFRTALWQVGCLPLYDDVRDRNIAIEQFEPYRRRMYTMGQGVYYNEADYHLEKWQEEFWGDNYSRLQQIKGVWDPGNFFTCHMCVQTEQQQNP